MAFGRSDADNCPLGQAYDRMSFDIRIVSFSMHPYPFEVKVSYVFDNFGLSAGLELEENNMRDRHGFVYFDKSRWKVNLSSIIRNKN